MVDSNKLGWDVEKAEGLALVDERTLAVSNDNDYWLIPVGTDFSVAAVRFPDESLPQVVWLLRFAQAIHSY